MTTAKIVLVSWWWLCSELCWLVGGPGSLPSPPPSLRPLPTTTTDDANTTNTATANRHQYGENIAKERTYKPHTVLSLGRIMPCPCAPSGHWGNHHAGGSTKMHPSGKESRSTPHRTPSP